MSYLMIENKGEAEIESITLMGASTKRNESDKIGLFGTGNKYALAVLLREKIGVCMYIGERRVNFETHPCSMRGQEFNRIVMNFNGEVVATGFTVEMGIKWGPENALREFVSNAIDEGELKLASCEQPKGSPGVTRIFVEMSQAVQKFLDESKTHFLALRNDAPLFVGGGVELWPRSGDRMKAYRRGVLCFTHSKHEGLYDYNFQDIDLAEDRKASESGINFKFATTVDHYSADAKRRIIQNIERDTFEAHCPDLQYTTLSSADWKAIIGDKIVCSAEVYDFAIAGRSNRSDFIRTSDQWAKSLVNTGCKSVNDYLSHTELMGRKSSSLDNFEEAELALAVKFLNRAGYNLSVDDIHIFQPTQKSDLHIMGCWDAKAQKIGINKACFDKGRQYLTETLLEEVTHRDTGFNDYTPEIQQHIFSKLVREMQRRLGPV